MKTAIFSSKKIEGRYFIFRSPYNAREYGANYHLLNTIAKYDNFTPKGKTGLRDYSKSAFVRKRGRKIFDDLIKMLISNTFFELQ